MLETARSILKRDPAAHSLVEVLLTYPGLHALFWHRIAHYFHVHKLYVLAGSVSHHATHKTGISISPAARIGRRVFIDHGVGVVIGETAVIEDDVTLFQGVTLGARHLSDEQKRHPHIEKRAFIGANAQILGPLVIGEDSKVGAGAVVLKDVPAGSTVVGSPAQIVNRQKAKVDPVLCGKDLTNYSTEIANKVLE